MNDKLTIDELEALRQISKARKHERPSACVARNAKRLSGQKFITYAKDGGLTLTDKGRQTLFVTDCIDGLRAIEADPLAKLDAGVVAFLDKKGHIEKRAEGGFELSQKGRESLDDIEAGRR
jgi:Mn-dependent DtxR family transcriptional regulator